MKFLKFIGALTLGLTMLNSCMPNTENQNELDEQEVVSYLNSHNIKYERSSYGFFYNIVDSGQREALIDSSIIDLNLVVKSLADQSIADTLLTKAIWDLSYPIRLGIVKTRIGGEINIYLPAYLNDGSTAAKINCKPLRSFENQEAADDTIINTYLKDNALTATKDSTGIYYNFTSLGSGSKPSVDSTITVKYTGRLASGYIFDQTLGSTTLTMKLNKLIPGWQIALPMLAEGGKGRIYIPSALAYGKSSTNVPANSVLIFDITLVDVSK